MGFKQRFYSSRVGWPQTDFICLEIIRPISKIFLAAIYKPSHVNEIVQNRRSNLMIRRYTLKNAL